MKVDPMVALRYDCKPGLEVIFVMKASSQGIPREVEPAWFVSPLPGGAAQR
jgi:hypothetical protein